MRLLRGLFLVVVLVAVGWVAFLTIAFLSIPHSDTAQDHFDTLIVLGTTPRPDGSPTPELRERVEEGVRQFRAGVAPHLIMTGGPAHSNVVEAQVMADLAASEGVPRDALVLEGQAKDTVQNIWYSRKIMQQNGWQSAEVVSSPYHLPRTGLILGHYKGPLAFAWKTDAAHWPPEYPLWTRLQKDYREAVYCMGLRMHGFHHSAFLPNS